MLPFILRICKEAERARLARLVDEDAARVECGMLLWHRRKHDSDRADRGNRVTLDTWPVLPKIRRHRRRWEPENK